MSGYVVAGEMGTPAVLGTGYKTQLRLVQAGTLMKRSRTFEMEVAAAGVPNATDCPIQVGFQYVSATADGSGSTTIVAQPLDAGTSITNIDVAVTLCHANYVTEPTALDAARIWWSRAFNQRSGVLWQAAPGREIYAPAVASAGPILQAKSPNYASTLTSKIMFDEI